MIVLLALASALFYGAADFCGGFTARKTSTIATVFVSQLAGFVPVLLALPFLPAAHVSNSDWLWGVIAGLSGGIGVALLYQALAIGTMAVVAPITAVCAAMIPVIVAFLLGERLRHSAIIGIALAFAAIALVSQPSTRSRDRSSNLGSSSSSLLLALLAGIVVGLFFLSLARTTTGAGMWPLIAARITSVVLFGSYALTTGQSLKMNGTATKIAVTGGVLDMLANIVYMLAARAGPLSIVVTLASLYPAGTVILARIVLRERLSLAQVLGIVCAVVAVLLIVTPGN